MKKILAIAGALAVLGLAAPAQAQSALAQTYPSRPISLVLPLPAGSGMDSIARMYGEKLSKALGQPVIIDNKTGAAFMLATQFVAAAPPDGHTLLVATSGPMAINPYLYKKIAYDPVKDFTPVSLYLKSPFVLVIDPALGPKTVPDLVALMKSSKIPLTYVTPGAGNMQHLATEYVEQALGVTATHVPYRNSNQSILDIVAGHANFGFVEAGASIPLVRDGRLRALAVSSRTRLAALPEAPPFAEVSGIADFEAVSWHMMLAPSATPKPIIDKLQEAMKTIMGDPELRARIAELGLIPFDSPDTEGMRSYIAQEREKWGGLVRKLGLEGSQ